MMTEDCFAYGPPRDERDAEVERLRRQIAERDAEITRLNRLADAISRDCNDCANQRNEAMAKAVAAERAREDAGGLLRDAWGFTTCDEELFHRIAAFLAANVPTHSAGGE